MSRGSFCYPCWVLIMLFFHLTMNSCSTCVNNVIGVAGAQTGGLSWLQVPEATARNYMLLFSLLFIFRRCSELL
ncbi:hypothetical protein RJT34_13679 [Clitoria ternatea]|uniref:Secreted protein n=1 Tax=Clitoria ternatea TaxID=43366 RepID=A0AAN9JPD8_CLITE